jgi:hypothetical protein
MQGDLTFHLQILRPGNVVERLVVPGGRILIGSGAHCDIRVDGTGCAREHVELELEGEHVVARARHHSPPPMLNGQPLVATKLDPDAQIAVCGTRITVNVVRDTSGTTAKSPARKFATTLAVALTAVVLPLAVYVALMPNDDDAIGPAPKAVALWEQPVVTCKVEAPDQALHLARDLRAAGEAKRERAPFAVHDGVSAVTAFESAAACHRVAGRRDEAALDDAAATSLRVLVEREYASRRLRLEHALETEDFRAASAEVHVLRSLTGGRHGAYVDWLAIVDRRLELNAKEAEQNGG